MISITSRILLSAVAAAFGLCIQSVGMAQSAANQMDERIKTLNFVTPNEVILVKSIRGYATAVEFPLDESIESCGGNMVDCLFMGQTTGWQIVGKKGDHLITFKPGSLSKSTNLIVRTTLATYVIELQLLPDNSSNRSANWQIMIRHPKKEVVAPTLPLTPEDILKGQPDKRNRQYTIDLANQSSDIQPSEIFDDGRFTYIRLSNNREIPSVFRVAPDQTESIVNRHMEGEFIVLHEVARRWVLRLSSQVISVFNEAYDPEGVAPESGTINPNVQRTLTTGQKND